MTDLDKKAARQALDALEYHVAQTRPIQRTTEAIATLRAALARQAKPVHGLVSDVEYLRLFEDARAGSGRRSGLLRGIRAVIAAYEAAAPVAEPVAVQAEPVVDRAQERSADDNVISRAARAEPVGRMELMRRAHDALEWHYSQGHSNTLGGFRLKIDQKILRDLKATLSHQAEPVAEPHRRATDADNGQSMTQADSGNPSY
jgi:hypothetical protein